MRNVCIAACSRKCVRFMSLWYIAQNASFTVLVEWYWSMSLTNAALPSCFSFRANLRLASAFFILLRLILLTRSLMNLRSDASLRSANSAIYFWRVLLYSSMFWMYALFLASRRAAFLKNTSVIRSLNSLSRSCCASTSKRRSFTNTSFT